MWYDNTYHTVNYEEHRYTVTSMKTGYTAVTGNNLARYHHRRGRHGDMRRHACDDCE